MEKRALRVGILFAVIYTVSYLTRTNFGAIVSEMEQATGIGRELLSLSLTGSFCTYGIGQIVCGIAVDKVSPKKMITLGLRLTSLMNVLLPMCKSPYSMLAVWCINGFAQSMMWPPIVKMMSGMLTEEAYKKAAVIVSWGSSVGTILVYLLSPLVISAVGWKWVFWMAALIGVIVGILWQRFSYQPVAVSETKQKETGKIRVLFTPLMIGVMAAIILQGMLRDGVTTWMPTYIIETYSWSTASSILTGVILPVFSIICFQIAARLHRKVFPNPLQCAAAFFGMGLLMSLVLYAATGKNAVISILMAALLTGSMHGVNLMLISMIPNYFKRYGLTGTASGVLNSCTYVGSAISTYGVAVLSREMGWKPTILIWIAIAVMGTVLCLCSIGSFKKQFSK